jgi:hypothetical protein
MTVITFVEGLRHLAEKGRVDVVPLKSDNRFWALASALTKHSRETLQAHHRLELLALDPGETTGCAIWYPSTEEIYLFQLDTRQIGPGHDHILFILKTLAPAHVRYEDYRVYGHMTDQHAFAHLHTARFIGAIEVALHIAELTEHSSSCLAVHAKAFWTDEKLKMCNLYDPGMNHARDAQRHLLRYMCEPF